MAWYFQVFRMLAMHFGLQAQNHRDFGLRPNSQLIEIYFRL